MTINGYSNFLDTEIAVLNIANDVSSARYSCIHTQ